MSSLTPDQIVSNMIAKAAVVDPTLDTSVGSIARKIFEVVAESASEIQIDNHLSTTFLDLDTRSGKDLEDIVGFFNYGRFQGSYASGSLTLTLSVAATQPVIVPAGSIFAQVGTGTSFQSLVTVTIAPGGTSASVSVKAVVVGPSGNAAANTVKSMRSGNGISAVNNPVAFTGGTEDESDEALRSRFKKTILRNIAGTEDFYIGVCLQADTVNRVKVLGPVTTYEGQLQAPAAPGTVNFPGKSVKYVWPKGFGVAENKNTASEVWYTEGVEFTATSGALTAPVMTTQAVLNNKFLDVTYEYNSTHSRNDPVTNKTNKIDVFVDGTFSTASVLAKLAML